MTKALARARHGAMSVACLRAASMLFVLLMAGCAGIGRAPQPDAPPVAVAPAVVIVAAEPQRAPAAPPAEPVPAAPPIAQPPSVAPRVTEPPITQPRIAQAPPSATVAHGTVMTAPVAQPAGSAASGTAAGSVAEHVTEPKAPAKVAATPVRATAPAPAVPPVPAVLPAPAAQAPRAPTPTPAATKPEAHPPLDLKSLETRLKETKAIGVFSKLALKNQIDDLLDRFRAYYQGRLKTTLAELRRAFDMLVLKTVALLQDADPPLAGAVASSRESIWGVLSDPAKFPKD